MKLVISTAALAGSWLFGISAGAQTLEAPKAPMAKKIAKVETLHGDRRQDDYFWLREKKNPDVKAYLDSENTFTDAFMKPTEGLQENLYREMLGRIKETDLSVPYRYGGFFYYTRTEQGKAYPIYCRKKGSLESAEEVILDVNELARGEKFMAVAVRTVSDDGRLLAYTTDNTGFREYTLHVKDLTTGKVFPERVEKVSSVAWSGDNRTLFYIVDDRAKRPYRLYRHVVGFEPSRDVLVYEERDEMFNLYVERSRSRKFILIASGSHTASEWRFVPADEPKSAPRLVQAREKDHEYDVEHRGDLFYIRTNQGCRNFRVVTAPVETPGKANWKEIVPCRDDVMVAGVHVFSGFWATSEREDGLPKLRVTDFETGESHRVDFPEAVYSVFFEANPEFELRAFHFNYQSLTIPQTVYEYDVKSRQRTLLKRVEVLGDYDPDRYVAERRYATASDGTRIPISLVYRKGLEKNGQNPTLLMGYGSYGAPMFPTFNSNRISLLDRGFVYAIGHIRGGGEMGKKWHDHGRMMEKKNTFTDFIAVAETLIAEKYTSKDRLAIEGGSAGGLLMGAVVNMRPDLFHVVISRVPFVDVINTMLDESLPLTVGEFEEWGNPRNKAEYEYMRTYSPYDNVAPKAYPTMLIKTSFNDSQVMYWEPAKYVARLRAVKTDQNPLVFKINMAGGHGGSSGRYDRLHEAAFDYAFLLTQLQVASAGS